MLDGITDSLGMSLSGQGVGDGQGGLACCSPWGHKEFDTTERLNNNDDKRMPSTPPSLENIL